MGRQPSSQSPTRTTGREPSGYPSERDRNLASVLATALRLGTATRSELIADTGLSKATVARMVEELTGLRYLTATSQATEPHGGGRGRRPDALTVSPELGQVIGVSFDLRRTVVLSTDLAGRELFHRTHEAPPPQTLLETVSWLQGLILEARDHRAGAPLRRVVVAVPARVVAGAEISHPPDAMSALAGTAFASALASALGTEVVLDSDANTALTGILAEESISDEETSVLFNMGTSLTVSQRHGDGATARGWSSAFGDLSLIPCATSSGVSTIGDMLSRHGLERSCEERGVAPEALSHLLGQAAPESRASDPQGLVTLQADFLEAVLLAIRIYVVTIDPRRVILAGRLFPLAERILPALRHRLAEEFDEPPRIDAVALHGTTHSTAHGAARLGVTHVQRLLRAHVASGAQPHTLG